MNDCEKCGKELMKENSDAAYYCYKCEDNIRKLE